MKFFIPGIPAPGGSKRAIPLKTGRIIVTDDCKRNKDWRATVALVASERIKEPLTCALKLGFQFQFPRPKGHYGKRGLKPSAPAYKTTKPDVTKLIRSTEDALTGIAWRDDAQIVEQRAHKIYHEPVGCWIVIEPA